MDFLVSNIFRLNVLYILYMVYTADSLYILFYLYVFAEIYLFLKKVFNLISSNVAIFLVDMEIL